MKEKEVQQQIKRYKAKNREEILNMDKRTQNEYYILIQNRA